jgi:2-polyprenyl-3-methyl-5-hydroxy-6-metoxy-1,4-benzoquinol methylase
MTLTLTQGGDKLLIDDLPDGRRLLTVVPENIDIFMYRNQVDTSYPLELVEMIFRVSGAAGICHEIMRDEDPSYVERILRNDLFAYFNPADFQGKTILDFGCGSGASTMVLARMFPESQITGIEMVSDAIPVAKKRAEFHGFKNVTFLQSPSETQIPDQIGQFDFVILSAVYEHLLPHERKILLPQLWSLVRERGFLFLNQTPNRLFPFELHTTMLPFINYLPDNLTFQIVSRFSKRIRQNQTWNDLLREGIRGATVQEIMRNLSQGVFAPLILEPRNGGLKDRIDLYYKNTGPRMKSLKGIARYFIKAIRAVSGLTIIPDLSLAFQKLPEQSRRAD